MKKIVTIICLISSSIMYSQGNAADKIFVLHLLEEGILTTKNIDDSKLVYNSDLIKIELDSLDSYGPNILFYKFELGKNAIEISDKNVDMSIHMSSCQEYIMAYNIENNNSYRIKGFNGNDLLFLIKDINGSGYKFKKTKKILTELNDMTLGVDFTCIYKALRTLDFGSPCLKACIDGKESH